jgi:hypothetical protein
MWVCQIPYSSNLQQISLGTDPLLAAFPDIGPANFTGPCRSIVMATVPNPEPQEPEIPVPDPGNHPERDAPIEPKADLAADLAPETVNSSEEDEDAQGQSVAADAAHLDESPYGLEDTVKVSTGDPGDDVEDLVDHMRSMVRSGRIDMDAYRGERNDDDEEGTLGPAGEDD